MQTTEPPISITNNPHDIVPKNPKKEQATENSPGNGSAATTPATDAAVSSNKKAVKSGKKPARKIASKKAVASKGGKKAASKKSTKAAELAEPSDADIRLRAYFIAERRVQLALQGDPAKDWLDAKQQLLEEARQARS